MTLGGAALVAAPIARTNERTLDPQSAAIDRPAHALASRTRPSPRNVLRQPEGWKAELT